MSSPAILGGAPVRTTPFPRYPITGSEEVEAATRVINSGNLCAQGGVEVEAFEDEFATYCGAKFGIATSNGTTALHSALAALGIGVGDEVIVPPYTFLSTATSVLMQNALPVFADIEPNTLGLDPAAVEAAVTPRTAAIIVVHMNGFPAEMDSLLAVARRHGLAVIEDCSHAHGAEFKGHKVGTLGDIGIFSFQQRKNLSLGEGGILVTDNPALATKLQGLRSFGDAPLAYNYRMSEIHAAIGRVRLRRLDAENDVRNHNAALLDSGLGNLPGLTVQRPRSGDKAVYYNFVVRYDQAALGISRELFMQVLEAEGIPVPQIYFPLYRHRTFTERNAYGQGFPFTSPFYKAGEQVPRYEDGMCPVAEWVCDHSNIDLKVHPPADLSDMTSIVDGFTKVIEHRTELQRVDLPERAL